jgi:hypothetical protein
VLSSVAPLRVSLFGNGLLLLAASPYQAGPAHWGDAGMQVLILC